MNEPKITILGAEYKHLLCHCQQPALSRGSRANGVRECAFELSILVIPTSLQGATRVDTEDAGDRLITAAMDLPEEVVSHSALARASVRAPMFDSETAQPWIRGARATLRSAQAHVDQQELLDGCLLLLATFPFDPDLVDPDDEWETLQPVLRLGISKLTRHSVLVAQHRFPEHAYAHALVQQLLGLRDESVSMQALWLAWFLPMDTRAGVWLDRMLEEENRNLRGSYLPLILRGRDGDPGPDIRRRVLARATRELGEPQPESSTLLRGILDWYLHCTGVHQDWHAWALELACTRTDSLAWEARHGLAAHRSLPDDLLTEIQSGFDQEDSGHAADRRACLYLHAQKSEQSVIASKRLDELLERGECSFDLQCHALADGLLTETQKEDIVKIVHLESYAHPGRQGSWELLTSLGKAWHVRLPELEEQLRRDERRVKERREGWYIHQSVVKGLQLLIGAARN